MKTNFAYSKFEKYSDKIEKYSKIFTKLEFLLTDICSKINNKETRLREGDDFELKIKELKVFLEKNNLFDFDRVQKIVSDLSHAKKDQLDQLEKNIIDKVVKEKVVKDQLEKNIIDKIVKEKVVYVLDNMNNLFIFMISFSYYLCDPIHVLLAKLLPIDFKKIKRDDDNPMVKLFSALHASILIPNEYMDEVYVEYCKDFKDQLFKLTKGEISPQVNLIINMINALYILKTEL